MNGDVLNRKSVRQFILRMCQVHRSGHEFDRVSLQAIDELDLWLKSEIIRRVKSLPSVGKTVKW